VHASAYPLVACISGFQNCWSPFFGQGQWQGERLNKDEKQKNQLPPAPQKEKTRAHRHECMLSLPIVCMKFLFSKLFIAFFGLG
jgi:hypothetical protein